MNIKWKADGRGIDQCTFNTLDEYLDFSALLEHRRIMISGVIDDNLAKDVIMKAWFLYTRDSVSPITLIINSGGGSVISGFAIWDQLKMLPIEVCTVVTGIAASMATVLALSGNQKMRFATENARFMIHQPSISGVVEGQVSDLEIQAAEIKKTRNKIVDLYVKETGGNYDDLHKDIDRDFWMSTNEAKTRGFINSIIYDWEDITKAKN